MFRLRFLVVPLFAALATATPTTVPSTQATASIEREIAHLASVEQRLAKHPQLAANAYTRLELAIARRFIKRLQSGGGEADKALEWKLLQTDEIAQVLNHTEATIAAVEAGTLPPDGLGPVPTPTSGAVKIDNGVLVTDTILRPGDKPTTRPFYFGGFGHFQTIVNDLPNFSELGVTLVQDGRNGPKQGLAEDRTLTPAGREVEQMLATAAKSNVKIDILTSPHYFPAWAGIDVNDINNPAHRGIIEAWLKQLAAQNKNSPALMSYCLSNEPMYSNSGRDQFTAKVWARFLENRHKTIEQLNKVYETTYKSFDEVPASGWPETDVGRRRAYDWACFNNEHFAAWHKWMGGVLKTQDPRALTHAKIMVFFTLDQNQAGSGIDPEQFCLATDLAGCDSYAQMIAGVGPLDESTSKDYAYHWQVQELCYDLLHSFKNQPVFNSENHPIENATGAYRFPAKHARSVIWQGGIHHQSATTTWVWEDPPSDPSLLHSIYYRPAYLWGHQRALLDLNRLSPEVTALNRAKPTVAIVYSPTSRFWEPEYGKAVRTVYTALTFLGHNITFISERQLLEPRALDFDAIVLPKVTHLPHQIYDLMKIRKLRERFIAAGNCLEFDEYHRKSSRGLSSQISLESEKAAYTDLNKSFASRRADIDVWGVEYRIVDHAGKLLVPMINHLRKPQTVTISIDHAEDEAVDLLSGEIVPLKNLTLEPMEPMLLKVSWK